MIYTSRYSNPELKTGNYTVVGITRGAPKFPLRYTLAGNIMEIAPPGYLFNEYNRERFTPPYFQHMDRVGTARIAQILQHYEDMGKPVVLCVNKCDGIGEVPPDFYEFYNLGILVFAEWWLQRTGEMIEELPDPSPNKWAKQPEPQKAVEPDAVQMKMW